MKYRINIFQILRFGIFQFFLFNSLFWIPFRNMQKINKIAWRTINGLSSTPCGIRRILLNKRVEIKSQIEFQLYQELIVDGMPIMESFEDKFAVGWDGETGHEAE